MWFVQLAYVGPKLTFVHIKVSLVLSAYATLRTENYKEVGLIVAHSEDTEV